MATAPTSYATASDVKLVAPEFSAVDDAFIGLWLGVAREKITPQRAGNLTCMCSALIAAHFLSTQPQTPDGSGGSATFGQEEGVVTAEADGPASRSFGFAAALDGDGDGWGSSVYGRRYMLLRRCFRGTGAGVVARRVSDGIVRGCGC